MNGKSTNNTAKSNKKIKLMCAFGITKANLMRSALYSKTIFKEDLNIARVT